MFRLERIKYVTFRLAASIVVLILSSLNMLLWFVVLHAVEKAILIISTGETRMISASKIYTKLQVEYPH